MIILDLSDSGLVKALSAPSSNVSVPGGGGQKGGPGGQPKPGHKYVKRTWDGNKWVYEYATEAHPKQHGMGYVGHEEHTVDLPESVDSGQMTAEEAYNQSRQTSLKTPDTIHKVTDPTTGKEMELHVVPAKAGRKWPHGIKIVPRTPMEETKSGKQKKGKVLPYVDKGWSSWAGVERWMRMAKDVETISGPNGEPMYHIMPNVGQVSAAEDVLKPPVSGSAKRIRIGFDKSAPEYNPSSSNNGIYAKDMEEAKQKIALYQRNQKLVDETAAGKVPSVGDQLQENNPLEVLQTGNLPRVRNPENPRQVITQFDSPEQKDEFINYLAGAILPQTYQLADQLTNYDFLQRHKGTIIPRLTGLDVDVGREMARAGVDPSQFQVDKNTPLYRFLDRVATYNSYNPESGSLEDYAFRSLPLRFFAWIKEQGFANEQQMRQLEGAASEIAEERRTRKEGGLTGEAAEKFSEQREHDPFQIERDIADWRQEQTSALEAWAEKDPMYAQQLGQLKQVMEGLRSEDDIGRFTQALRQQAEDRYRATPGVADMFNEQVLKFLEKAIKSLTAILVKSIAIKAIAAEFTSQIAKASTNAPPPDHQYSHKDGMDDHPVYWWKDGAGNLVRYTNAPEGSEDYSPLGGSPKMHPSEVMADNSPEFFTPDGRKLTRAPHSMAQAQWNPNYHRNDPQNLWAARWVNPATGEHEFSYIESDILSHDKLVRHHQNRIIDVRIPHMRQYISGLLHSDQAKDAIVGLMMALVDQGRIHPVELVELRAGDIQINGDVIRFGRFAVHAGEKIQQIIHRMMTARNPEDPFFSIPVVKNMEDSAIGVGAEHRVIGPHYIMRMFDRIGTPLGALMNYHATQTYSMQVQRCIQGENVSLRCGHEFALLEVARRMGHDFTTQPDVNPIIKFIEENMIDPIVIEVIEANARKDGTDQGADEMTREIVLAVPHISANLTGHTDAEREFSKWAHAYPCHEHVEAKRMYEPAA